MPASIREVLARVARELEDEEAAEAFEELKGKKPTWEEVRDAIAAAPPEERAALRALLIEEGAPPEEVKGKGNGKKEPPPAEPPVPDDAQPGPPKRRTRPGRRSGGAYDWYVDEESGEVVRSPVAVIYTGEDEPDEVEMLDAGDDDEGEGGDDE